MEFVFAYRSILLYGVYIFSSDVSRGVVVIVCALRRVMPRLPLSIRRTNPLSFQFALTKRGEKASGLRTDGRLVINLSPVWPASNVFSLF